MMDISAHMPTVWAMGAMGALLLVQVLVVDFAGIKSGHKPGTPVAADRRSFLFRAVRAHANANETIAIFLIFALGGMLSGAPATGLGYAAWVYVASRTGHMVCYYADWSLARSIAFGISLAGLFAMGVANVRGWVV